MTNKKRIIFSTLNVLIGLIEIIISIVLFMQFNKTNKTVYVVVGSIILLRGFLSIVITEYNIENLNSIKTVKDCNKASLMNIIFSNIVLGIIMKLVLKPNEVKETKKQDSKEEYRPDYAYETEYDTSDIKTDGIYSFIVDADAKGEYAVLTAINERGVKITVPEKVILEGKTLKVKAFTKDCFNIVSDSVNTVVLPKTLTKLTKTAFEPCINLSNIEYGGSKDMWDLILLEGFSLMFSNADFKYLNQ